MSDELILNKTNENLPTFMQPDTTAGTESMGEFIRPPRLRVVQPLSKELTAEFNVGDLVVVPQRIMVVPVKLNDSGKSVQEKSNAGESFRFVPIFFWPEWIQWNSRMITDEPAVLQQTTDKNNPLVVKCRNRDLWEEDHPTKPGIKVRNTEHLNFAIMLLDGSLAGELMVMSFVRSEHKCGTAFAGLIRMRKAPIYGCIFEGSTGYRENPQGEWYGIDVVNPSEDPFVQSKDLYEHFKASHETLLEAHERGMIKVDHDGSEGEPEVQSSNEF